LLGYQERRLLLMRTSFQSGVTLIEVMVVLSIAAILVSLAIPGYTTWIADAQIRSGAESLGSGLRYAKAQAILRNEPVRLVLDPTTGTGGWQVQLDGTGAVLQRGQFIESARRDTFTVAPPAATKVTYTALGQVQATNTDLSAPMTSVRVTIPGARELDVVFGGVGGNGIKICDPSASLPANDQRRCPT
jgi:type IV fimbrial biogenesis protein FimT